LHDPRVRKLSFTGSTEVGRVLLREAADQVVNCSMELGGNAPFLVFDDADLSAALDGAMIAKMRNAGEACTAANRFYVHESLAQEFSDKLAKRMGAMVVGNGLEDGVTVGPLITAKAVAKVTELVDDAKERGATVMCGGSAGDGEGFFYPPTVLTGVPADADLVREEIFGPVAAIQTFTDEQDAIDRANDTEYGLASYFFTRDFSRVMRVSEGLDYGMVGVNQGIISNPAAPFGGVKASGFGREGGFEGIEEYLETKYVGLAL
ncbi:MAG: aldehyde dehydrogenase family protein, partial [Rhodococcus sp. (in: high G+C Gram-positive bacteria)]